MLIETAAATTSCVARGFRARVARGFRARVARGFRARVGRVARRFRAVSVLVV